MAPTEHTAFEHFTDTIAQLRDPESGCPWNLAQTHESLGHYLIEESYETLDAIEAGNVEHLQEELGDVLLQVVLQSQVAADAGEFTIDDVCRTIDEKMIRRHPHVFGDVDVRNENEVSVLWEQVKLAEKQGKKQRENLQDEKPSLLDDVPAHFPALMQAQKISRRAVAAGFEWDTLQDIWDKVAEEKAELMEAYEAAPKTDDGMIVGSDPQSEHAELEFGDLLFALVNVARRMGIDAEKALRASNLKFRKRFAAMEQKAREQGHEIEDLALDEMEALWQSAKEDEIDG